MSFININFEVFINVCWRTSGIKKIKFHVRKSGFTNELVETTEKMGNVKLVDLKWMYF